MGQVYYVHATLQRKPEHEKKAISAIQDFIKKKTEDNNVNFNLPFYLSKGLSLNIFSDLVHILLSDQDFEQDGNTYDSDFSASYGWYTVLYDFFETLAPFLTDDSNMTVDADESSTVFTVKDGHMIVKEVEKFEDEDDL